MTPPSPQKQLSTTSTARNTSSAAIACARPIDVRARPFAKRNDDPAHGDAEKLRTNVELGGAE
ncbi:hypothetical protein GCM10010344_64060 [Streptomyces bluensis]|nr:hypothetical protein GCM10010344_64060 [Streptomyces bluensis]